MRSSFVRKFISSLVLPVAALLASVLCPQSSPAQVPVRWYAESSRPVSLALDA